MRWCCQKKGNTSAKKFKLLIHWIMEGALDLPSPNPKQGIKLSSSKADKVFPTMDIACSYGLRLFPMWCKLRRLYDLEPGLQINFCFIIQFKQRQMRFYMINKIWKYKSLPVHSLLFVKSMPTMRFDDSRPARASASVTCRKFSRFYNESLVCHDLLNIQADE